MELRSVEDGNFAVIVSGGPAPGINSVIAAVVISAHNAGYKTYGFDRGFSGVAQKGVDAVKELQVSYVTTIATTGGSILGTSRFNPFSDPAAEAQLLETFNKLNIDKLVVIGGEGSAYLSHQIAQRVPAIRVAHVPKTIDNDLILPNKHPSFGFETARFAGSNILKTMISDAKTTNRWFIVKTMGRKAGFLALGMGIASGATITLIAEQFSQSDLTPDDVASHIFHSLKRRLDEGKGYGTAVLAEGILDKFDTNKVEQLKDSSRDDMGRLRFSEIGLEDLVAASLRRMCAEENIKMRFTAENIGYELRCREPVAFDIEYTRLLGFGAVRFLLEGQGDFMVVRDFDNLAYVPLQSMLGSDGTLRTRKVDMTSDVYKVASSFMIR